jgi:hypothetical protein
MTIDDVMTLAESVMATAGDVARGWVPVQHLTEREEVLRAAILALLDAEAEACAGIVTGWREADWPEGFSRMTAAQLADDRALRIRARIAARKRGNND